MRWARIFDYTQHLDFPPRNEATTPGTRAAVDRCNKQIEAEQVWLGNQERLRLRRERLPR